MEECYNRGYRIFYFRDDNLTTNKERMEAICRGIIRGIIEHNWEIAWCCMRILGFEKRELNFWSAEAGKLNFVL